jgi:hypothetical protein
MHDVECVKSIPKEITCFKWACFELIYYEWLVLSLNFQINQNKFIYFNNYIEYYYIHLISFSVGVKK